MQAGVLAELQKETPTNQRGEATRLQPGKEVPRQAVSPGQSSFQSEAALLHEQKLISPHSLSLPEAGRPPS